ncbi:MAG: dTMP kinase, partial [Anaerolineae bacterium]
MGLFVTFEGPEGCGKTTQLRLLAPYLRQQGLDVLATREPGGTPIGDRVRAVLLDPAHTEMLPPTEFLLFSAARAQHVGQVIRAHLARGGVVLCDRYADSSLAYQGYGHQQDLHMLQTITEYATAGLAPDLTLCLDLPVELGLRRKARGKGDAWNRMEQKEVAFHKRVRNGYLTMAAQAPHRWAIVDARQDIETMQTAIRRLVLARLSSGRRGETQT